MTRAGIFTKYNPGIHATRKGKSLVGVGKILQKGKGGAGNGESRSTYVGMNGKRIEGVSVVGEAHATLVSSKSMNKSQQTYPKAKL